MGIKGLFPYLQEVVPKAILDTELKRYTGRRLAIDASAWMYQFLSIVRTGSAAENLQNKEGQATSHLQGIVLRALKLLEVGVQPVFVFDGKPPDMKLAVNRARRQVRAAAAEEHAAAVASGTAPAEHVYKTASRSTVVTREHNQHAKDLLRTMGISVVQAPGEAEAACAQLCRAGKVYAAVTEDMDVLTFGSPRQIKNLFDVEGNRLRQGPRPAREINLGHVLEGLSQDAGSFIEFCILCGCDYLPHLPKIGPKTASQLLQREGSLSKVVRSIQSGKGPKGCTIPEDWDWKAAKKIFLEGPEELTDSELGREVLDLDAFRSLLVEKHQFNPSRVENMVERLRKVKEPGGPTQQKRLDTFFTVPSSPSPRKPPRGSKRSHADMIEADGSEQEPKANFLKPMEQICVEDTQ
ncbi:FEN11, partial [Symbiodinium sp. CCMP2592]